MFPFEKTELWRQSLGPRSDDDEADARALLRDRLLDVRRRTEQLVSLIVRDMPGLTIHDISHLDALWETASLIAGSLFRLNPAEAFVFGAAVYTHDAAMSLAAYPRGLEALRETPQWRDTVAMLLQERTGAIPAPELVATPPREIIERALPEVLRDLHALGAEKLPLQAWPAAGGQPEYLIQDSDMRQAYGSIIGRIASSHWWQVPDLAGLPTRVNAGPNIPANWFVEPLKLAGLLRTADAAHIDHRRAPRFLQALLPLPGASERHWTFQTKLGKPSLDGDFLVYTGGPFELADAESWWLAYDMINWVDDELHAVNVLLDSHGIEKFKAQGVKGSNSPSTVAQLITTEGWRPINTELRVSNVPALVELLGGKKLYGNKPTVALRELIQNSSDAIRARRLQVASPTLGTIRVSVTRDESEWILEVEDDGIGMSPFVLTGPLLDFGRSFWGSAGLRREFPGLLSKGLKTTGRYGIGFFSVFMLGDRVTVTSRRFDAAVADTHTLDFQRGLGVRPILRSPESSEILSAPGTRVLVRLRVDADAPNGLLFFGRNNGKILMSTVAEVVRRVAPALDVRVDVEEPSGECTTAVTAADWRTCERDDLLQRTRSWAARIDAERGPLKLREIVDPTSGECYGRAAFDLDRGWDWTGMVTVGGFSACHVRGLAGVLFGDPKRVSRDAAMPIASAAALRTWAADQVRIVGQADLRGAQKLRGAELGMMFGVAPNGLPIAVLRSRYVPLRIPSWDYLNAVAVANALRDLDIVHVYVGSGIHYDDDEDADISPNDFDAHFELADDIFIVPDSDNPLLSLSGEQWPACVPDLYNTQRPRTCLEAFSAVLGETWNCSPSRCEERYRVGDVQGQGVTRSVFVFYREVQGESACSRLPDS